MIYELRSYYAAPGKMDALNSRFRDHTCEIFERHGMTVVASGRPREKSRSSWSTCSASKMPST